MAQIICGLREESWRELGGALAREGWDLTFAPTTAELQECLRDRAPDVAIIESSLPGPVTARDLVARIKSNTSTCYTAVLLIGDGNAPPSDSGSTGDPSDLYLALPPSPSRLVSAVKLLLCLHEHAAAEGARRESEARAGFVVESSADHAYLASFPEENPNPIVEVDLDGHVHYANPAALELFPDIRESQGTHPWLAGWESVARSMTGGGARGRRVVTVGDRSYQQVLILRDGMLRTYGTDVTELKRAEAEREKLAEQLQFALDAARLGWWHYDPVTRLATFDRRYAEILGVSASPAPDLEILKLFRPEDVPRIWATVDAALNPADPKPYSAEYRVTRPDGAERWVEAHGHALFEGEGPERRARSFVGTLADITERKQTEEQVRQLYQSLEHRNVELDAERMRWQGVVEGIADEVWVCDAAGRMSLINLPETTAMGLDEFEDRSVQEVLEDVEIMYVDRRLRPPEEAPLLRSLRTGEIVRGEEIMRHRRSGRERYRQFSCAPMRDPAGRITGAVTIVRDITEIRRTEEALREADRVKNEFLALLSHELRNPLAPITNSLYILDHAAPGGNDAQRAHAIVGRQVRQLTRLVDDLLDVTRITRNKIKLHREKLEVNELVRRTIEDHRSLFDERQVTVIFDPAPAPLLVDGDWNRLAQVIGNLLQNAAKFTRPRGETRVSVAIDSLSDSGPKRVAIRVADTGVGMTPETLARIFKPFVQAETTLDRSKGGLGLGLALVRGLVELHGGDVTVHSAGLGRGAEFAVHLPLLDERPVELAGSPAARARSRRRVLIIEDNTDAAESLRLLLEYSGHEVAIAGNGPDGIALAGRFHPEIVLCDIGLPGMDGFEVARQFRADERLRNVRLVALSGYALPEDLQRAAEAGFDRHIAKPPDIEKIEEALADEKLRNAS